MSVMHYIMCAEVYKVQYKHFVLSLLVEKNNLPFFTHQQKHTKSLNVDRVTQVDNVAKLPLCILETLECVHVRACVSKLITPDQWPTVCGHFIIGVAALHGATTSINTEELGCIPLIAQAQIRATNGCSPSPSPTALTLT